MVSSWHSSPLVALVRWITAARIASEASGEKTEMRSRRARRVSRPKSAVSSEEEIVFQLTGKESPTTGKRFGLVREESELLRDGTGTGPDSVQDQVQVGARSGCPARAVGCRKEERVSAETLKRDMGGSWSGAGKVENRGERNSGVLRRVIALDYDLGWDGDILIGGDSDGTVVDGGE